MGSEIMYGAHDRQVISVFTEDFKSSRDPLIFVHGGAWRDITNTDKDAIALASFIADKVPLASVDYRLSPEVKYPQHNNDVLNAIKFLVDQYEIKTKIKLLGHSAGATIILAILSQVSDLVDEVFLVDGIYDLSDLVDEYGDQYKEFVVNAHDDYTKVDQIPYEKLRHIKFNIVHSYQDELLSIRQTKKLLSTLEHLKISYTLRLGNFGEHDDVYKSKELANFILSTYSDHT